MSGGLLSKIKKIDKTSINPLIFKSTFKIACDVENNLLGKFGASNIFAK